MADLFTRQQEPTGCSWCGDGSYGKKETTPWDENAAASLAQEMNELSVKERERVLDDIHGVAQIQEETEEFKRTCLQDMNYYLDKIQKPKRRAWDRALFFKPSLSDDSKFKLMFLRADQYDALKAANRLVDHFEQKLRIFGEDKLTKTITLDDLTPKDIEMLNVIGCVVLSDRDPVGRPIWFFDIERFNLDDIDGMMRCFWYQGMTSVADDKAQLKGICNVAYLPGDLLAIPSSVSKMTQLFATSGLVMDSLPCRISAFQFCYNDPRVRYVLNLMGKAFGKKVRLRIRTHYGSDVEMQYSLMTFGTKCSYLFRSAENDETKKKKHYEYIQTRRATERKAEEYRMQEEARSGIILHPQPRDVLVGRGRPYQEYPGNLHLLTVVDTRLNRYRNTEDRFEKTCIFMEVVKIVQDSGGRFLQKASQGWWKIASDKAAREKTASAFRSRLEKANNDEMRNNSDATISASRADASGRSSKRVRIS